MIGQWYSLFADGWWNWTLACLPCAIAFYLAAEAILRMGRNWPPTLRYFILLLVLLKCVIPAPWTLYVPLVKKTPPDLSTYLQTGIETLPSQKSSAQAIHGDSSPLPVEDVKWRIPPIPRILFILNLVRMLAVSGIIIRAIRRNRQSLKHAQPSEFLEGLCAPLCVHFSMKMPRIYVSRIVQGPFTGGYFFPYIVVPESVRHKSREHQISILSHELAHIRRRDGWINLIQVSIALIGWWNPIIARLNFLIRCEREHCCDDLVLHTVPIAPEDYSHVLLESAEDQVRYREHGWGLAFAYPRHAIVQRIRRMIMKPQKTKRMYWAAGGVIGVILAGSLFFGFQVGGAELAPNQNLITLMKGLQELQLVVMKAYSSNVELSDEELQKFAKATRDLGLLLIRSASPELDVSVLTTNKEVTPQADTTHPKETDQSAYQKKMQELSNAWIEAYRKKDTHAIDQIDKVMYEVTQKSFYRDEKSFPYQKGEMTNAELRSTIFQAKQELRTLQNALSTFYMDH